MIVHTEFAQRSVDWMLARASKPTASEFDNLVTPEFKPRKGATPDGYLYKKLAEWWQGGPLAGFNSWDMEQGQVLEDEARPWYALETGEDIQSVGLITTDDGKIACSPDGLIRNSIGLEIKCPAEHTQVRYLLSGELPPEYAAQVHGSMYVTGFKEWRFLSYRRHFPPFMLSVGRDEKIQAVLAEVLGTFLERFEAGKKRMCEINGGPPKHTAPLSTQEVKRRIDGFIDKDDFKM